MQLFQGRLLRAPCTYPRSKTTGNRKLKADSKEPEKYGDQICGVETDSIRLQTRLQQWRIQNVCSKNTKSAERRSAKHPHKSSSDCRGAFCSTATLEFC